MEFSNILIALGVAMSIACVTEGISWYFIYRHEEYKKLVKDINNSSKELDALKAKSQYAMATQSAG